MDWHEMNQEKYWKIFLKTDDKYKGIFFKEAAKLEQLVLVKRFEIGSNQLNKEGYEDIFIQNDSSKLAMVDYIKISFDKVFFSIFIITFFKHFFQYALKIPNST